MTTHISRIFRMPRNSEAVRKAARIVKDYVLDLYFPIHRISWRDGIKCYPLLLLVEYMVYRVDGVAEDARDVDIINGKNKHHFDKLTAQKNQFIWLLRRLGLYDSIIEHQLNMGEQYVRLENKMSLTETIDPADVMRTAELRATDVRLLHCLLFSILKIPYDEQLLALLWPVEVIADIGNDFDHYAEDVAKGNYNTYDMFVRLYQKDAPERIRSEIVKYESLFLERLAHYRTDRKDELKSLCTRFYRTHTTTIPEPKLDSRTIDRERIRASHAATSMS